MLLAFSAVLAALALAEPLYNALVMTFPPAAEIFWRFGVNFERYLLSSALFSLFFLGLSLIRKKPQAQFAIEIILAGLLYRLL